LPLWPPLEGLPLGRCDVLELQWADAWAAAEATSAAEAAAASGGKGGGSGGSSGSGGAAAAFGRRFLHEFVFRGRPVVLRAAAAGSAAQAAFAKANFVARYGHFAVGVGAIPYASSFGSLQRVTTLGDVANATAPSAAAKTAASSHKNNDHEDAAEYAFTTPAGGPGGWASLVLEDAPPPPWLTTALAQFPHAGGPQTPPRASSWTSQKRWYLKSLAPLSLSLFAQGTRLSFTWARRAAARRRTFTATR
jgi:hypothetical protein